MPFKIPEIATNARGGTELMANRLESYLKANHQDLLEFFNFHCSRVRDYDPNKPSVYWCHDLAEDPEAQHLANGGWQKFDLIVFVSNWQYQQYQKRFKLDGSNCIVINNGVERVKDLDPDYKWDWNIKNNKLPIKLIYHTTPHRGLELLVPAFMQLWEEKWQYWDNLVCLDVYSSFSIYGWSERDEPYQRVFDLCRNHPAINYHGAVSNEEIRVALNKAHIFAYPSIWEETSCIALIEAMQAKCVCIHPNLGALFETGGGFTIDYPFKSDPVLHYDFFQRMLDREVERVRDGNTDHTRLDYAYQRSKNIHNWNNLAETWSNVLTQIKEVVAS